MLIDSTEVLANSYTITSAVLRLNEKIKDKSYLLDYYKKSETSSSIEIAQALPKKVSDLPNDCNYLLSTNLSFTYDSNEKYIHLKAFNNDIGSVNCADFIKDGMLSSV